MLGSRDLTPPAGSHRLKLRRRRRRAGTGCSASEPQAWLTARPGSASSLRSSPAAPNEALPEIRPEARSPHAEADQSLRGRARQRGRKPRPRQPGRPRSPARTVKKEVESRQGALIVRDHTREGPVVRWLHRPDPRQVSVGPPHLSEEGQVLSPDLQNALAEAARGAETT